MHTRGVREASEDRYADEFWLPVDTGVRVDPLYLVDVWPTQDMLDDGVDQASARPRRRRRRYRR
jgi:hypothetical protein